MRTTQKYGRSVIEIPNGPLERIRMRLHPSLLPAAGLGILAISVAIGATEPAVDPTLRSAINSSARSPENKALDQDRHPLQTLTFFGIRPSMTVVEMWPAGGWYTEILAAYLRDHGKLLAASTDPESTDAGELEYRTELTELFAKRPQLFDKVQLSILFASEICNSPLMVLPTWPSISAPITTGCGPARKRTCSRRRFVH